jgi:hypothetical protein
MTGRRGRERYARGTIGGREFAHILFYYRDQADFRSTAINCESSIRDGLTLRRVLIGVRGPVRGEFMSRLAAD